MQAPKYKKNIPSKIKECHIWWLCPQRSYFPGWFLSGHLFVKTINPNISVEAPKIYQWSEGKNENLSP